MQADEGLKDLVIERQAQEIAQLTHRAIVAEMRLLHAENQAQLVPQERIAQETGEPDDGNTAGPGKG